MKRLVVVLALALVFAVSISAMAANGTWKMYAKDSTGSLTTGSHSAYYTTRIDNVQQPMVVQTGLHWTLTANNVTEMNIAKSHDYSSTVGTGADAVWNINDNNSVKTNDGTNSNTYMKSYITPDSFDSSRGLFMVKMKVNSGANATNTAIGISTGTNGVQIALRGNNGSSGEIRVRNGEGTTPSGVLNPADIDQSVYRVYAISWIGSAANVWYSNGNDWSGESSNWTQIASGYTMGTSTKKADGSGITGIAIFDGTSGYVFNADIQWIVHNTYDNINGQMNPWDFDPSAPVITPEPGSIVAMCSGLIGVLGFSRRRRA